MELLFTNKLQRVWISLQINLKVEDFKILKSAGETHCYVINGNDPVAKIGIFSDRKDSVKRFFGYIVAQKYQKADVVEAINDIVRSLWDGLLEKKSLPFMAAHKWQRVALGQTFEKNGVIVKKLRDEIAMVDGTYIIINHHTITCTCVGGEIVMKKFLKFLRW